MQAETWVNAVAVAVVAASLVAAWLSTHPGIKSAVMPKARAPKTRPKIRRIMRNRQAWLLLRNEEEIARRAAASTTDPPQTDERSGDQKSGTDQQAR